MKEQANTAALLREAAMEEFNESGFHGTDSNKIARRAGFSPQTFYRWYGDKIAVFIAAYEAWEQQERCELETLVDSGSSASIMANAIVRQHRHFQGFRRSLRQLAVENDQVRSARTLSRKRQADAIRKAFSLPASRQAEILIRLLQIERLADGLAEEEFRDLGVTDKAVKAQITDQLRAMQQSGDH